MHSQGYHLRCFCWYICLAWLGLAWIGLDLKISDLLNPKDEGKSRGVQQTRLTAALPEQYHSLDSQVG